MKSSLLVLAIVFVQRLLALGGGDEPAPAPDDEVVAAGGGEGGDAGSVPALHTPANAAAPSGGVL